MIVLVSVQLQLLEVLPLDFHLIDPLEKFGITSSFSRKVVKTHLFFESVEVSLSGEGDVGYRD